MRKLLGPMGFLAALTAPMEVNATDSGLAELTMLRNLEVPTPLGPAHADAIFPSSGGRLPVIIFSPGSGGSAYAYRELTSGWARRGFLVIGLTHADARPRLRAAGVPEDKLQATLLANGANPDAWSRRVGDVTAVLDLLPRSEQLHPALHGRADPARVGVAGHSFGAFTSMLLACATPTVADRGPVRLRDERPKAFLLLSAQGAGQQGLTETSWDSCHRPMMVVTGTEDRGQVRGNGQSPQGWREKLEPFTRAPPGDKVGIVLQGAAHSSFMASDRATAGPMGPAALPDRVKTELQVRIFSGLADLTAAWWAARLQGNGQVDHALRSGELARQTGVVANFQVK